MYDLAFQNGKDLPVYVHGSGPALGPQSCAGPQVESIAQIKANTFYLGRDQVDGPGGVSDPLPEQCRRIPGYRISGRAELFVEQVIELNIPDLSAGRVTGPVDLPSAVHAFQSHPVSPDQAASPHPDRSFIETDRGQNAVFGKRRGADKGSPVHLDAVHAAGKAGRYDHNGQLVSHAISPGQRTPGIDIVNKKQSQGSFVMTVSVIGAAVSAALAFLARHV